MSVELNVGIKKEINEESKSNKQDKKNRQMSLSY
jgi:hypothetical protein